LLDTHCGITVGALRDCNAPHDILVKKLGLEVFTKKYADAKSFFIHAGE
jgi:hypothetical protein